MKIAIPVRHEMTFYHDNPCTAPKFALYAVEGKAPDIRYRLLSVIENPWSRPKCDHFSEEQIQCACDEDRRNNVRHICEHYALLDAVTGCSYLLADRYCENTARALRNGGITLFKVPPIIDRIDGVIKNFLIGSALASKVQHINRAS